MIKAIITDFDGTLVDTFKANLLAYQMAFHEVGITLTSEKYRECFGLRFDSFLGRMGIFDVKVAKKIKELKKEYYPHYFDYLIPNHTLIELVASFHKMGGKTAIASTARKENLMNAVEYLRLSQYFDLIYAGIDVKFGKPDPEIYNKAIASLGVQPSETLIFEDSDTGVDAAIASNSRYIRVTEEWFNYKQNEN